MAKRIYLKLALNGIGKNRELYYPYLLSGAVISAVFYILAFLSRSEYVSALRGGDAVTTLLKYFVYVTGIFALPFLFYTNAAIIKRRKRELGLYSVLGMNKRALFILLAVETLITYIISIGTGCVSGVILSKLFELILGAIMAQSMGYALYADLGALGLTLCVFALIYLIILINAALGVKISNPVELLSSDAEGERPPRAGFIPSLLGALFLIAGYVISLTTLLYIKKNLVSNLVGNGAGAHNEGLNNILQFIIKRGFSFFMLVLLGTLLIFMSAGVFICERLKQNIRYYYKTTHFVTVSQLLYRIKRSGLSLSIICILSTLILIALTGAAGFFDGITDIVKRHYPYDLYIGAEADADMLIGKDVFAEEIKENADKMLYESDGESDIVHELYFVGLCAAYKDKTLDLTVDFESGWKPDMGENEVSEIYEDVVGVRVIELSMLNKMLNEEYTLSDNGALLCGYDDISYVKGFVGGIDGLYTVDAHCEKDVYLTPFALYGSIPDTGGMDTITLAVNDIEDFFGNLSPAMWDKNNIRYMWEYDLSLNMPDDAQYELLGRLNEITGADCSLRIEREGEARGLSGGLLFLAIIIAAFLVFVTVLIMYYKQISEGYEDEKRFLVMQKVGMTPDEVKGSISAQMRAVFLFPLIASILHLAFALPLIRLALMWTVRPKNSIIFLTALVSAIIFAAAYLLVYTLTTRVYFRIVTRQAP